MRWFRFLPFLALGAAVLVAFEEPAYCDDSGKEAEKLRLQEEMTKLASKNAWAGVESKYQALVDLKLPLTFDDHFYGAQSARFLGKTYETYNRLDAARQIDPRPEILTELEGIDAHYGRVEIKGNPRRRPELVAAMMPFAPDERKSIEYAMEVVVNTGSFKGMLPFGEYTVGDKTFTVAEGKEFQIVQVSKNAGTVSEGTIVYAGPIVSAGYQFSATPAPGSAPGGDVTVEHPDTMAGSGIAIDAGAEIGFSKTFGVAATVGYTGLYGGDILHGVSGWAAMTVRPGELRIAAGPTYGMIWGRGVGMAEWWDIGHDQAATPNSSLDFVGLGLVGGARMSVGYGVIDFSEKIQGSVELGGSWQFDGVRSYFGGGLRVGIVPKIQRYKG